jgi:uncharacterized protein YukE
MSVPAVSGLPTLSQVRDWQTEHLNDAANRWKSAADTWTTVYGGVAGGLPAPLGTAWEGDASQAAQARMNTDRAGVETLAARLRTATRVAEDGALFIDAAKREALMVVSVAGALGFDVQDDLTVIDRVSAWPPPADQLRRRQAQLLTMNVQLGAAQLASVDQQVAQDMKTVTSGFDAVDFKQTPIIEPVSQEPTAPSFGGCFSDNFKEDIGENMVQGVFVGGALGAVRGAVVGILGGPFGVFGGSVLGFVGGAAQGAIISGPLRTAATSAWDCL